MANIGDVKPEGNGWVFIKDNLGGVSEVFTNEQDARDAATDFMRTLAPAKSSVPPLPTKGPGGLTAAQLQAAIAARGSGRG